MTVLPRIDRRGAGLVAGVLGAVALVALASHGDHGGSGDSILTLSSEATSATRTVLLLVIGVLMAGVLVLVLFSFTLDKADVESKPLSWRRIVATMLVVLAMASVMQRTHPSRSPEVLDQAPGRGVSEPARPGRGSDGSGAVSWGIGAGGLLVLVGAASAYAIADRRRRDRRAPEAGAATVATPAERDDAVARANACTDPREAVLLAFAAAEAVLSDDPATRRPPATSAREWSARVGVPPLATIVARYEIARFSDHEVGERDRRIALDALAGLA